MSPAGHRLKHAQHLVGSGHDASMKAARSIGPSARRSIYFAVPAQPGGSHCRLGPLGRRDRTRSHGVIFMTQGDVALAHAPVLTSDRPPPGEQPAGPASPPSEPAAATASR
jgi:hypothetical protein